MSSFKLFILSLLFLAALGLVIAVVIGAGGVFAADQVNTVIQALP